MWFRNELSSLAEVSLYRSVTYWASISQTQIHVRLCLDETRISVSSAPNYFPQTLLIIFTALNQQSLRPFACWDCGFESHRGHGSLSVVSVVCCQVEREVSATSWSVVHRCVWSRNLVNEEALAHCVLLRQKREKETNKTHKLVS